MKPSADSSSDPDVADGGTQVSPRRSLPSAYWAWASTAALSMLGMQIVGFAMGWAAAGQGPMLAGVVLTATVLPRTLLLLLGGVVADRSGIWRVLLLGDGAMLLATLVLAATSLRWGTPAPLLVVMALIIGTVSAFYMPASGALPRVLLVPEQLPQGMALRQTGQQLAMTIAGPAAGVVYAAAGLSAAAVINAATYAAMLLMVLHLRRRHPEPDLPPSHGSSWEAAREGLAAVASDRLLRPALLLVSAGAALLLPLVPLLFPLLGREAAWGAQLTGTATGAVAGATAVVALLTTIRGALGRPGAVAIVGVLVAGVGAIGLGLAAANVVGVLATSVMIGGGTGMFATHIAPLILGSAPREVMARVQAIAALAQSLPLVVANLVIGAVAEVTNAAAVTSAVGLAMLGIAAIAWRSVPLRTATAS